MRYALIDETRIISLSDHPLIGAEKGSLIEIPAALESLSSDALIARYIVMGGAFVESGKVQKASTLRCAIISNFAQQCGVAEYGQKLFRQLIPMVNDFHFFIEEVSHPTTSLSSLDGVDLSGHLTVCWKRGESLSRLAKEVIAYNPDIVLINYEPGIFPTSRYLLSLMSQLDRYPTFAIVHSVFPGHRDKLVSLSSFKNIVVHLGKAKTFLDETLTANVSVLAHGCNDLDGTRLWNVYRSKHTLLLSGYGLAYKGVEDAIQAVALLKPKYPDVFFTCLFSETSPDNTEHRVYYERLIKVVDELALHDNVAVLRGYRTDIVLDSFYRTNRVALFPYKSSEEHRVFGASGSARLAMSKGVVVVSSSIPHFSDLPTIKAENVEGLAKAIDELWSDEKMEKEQLMKQAEYLKANSWKKCAERLVEIIEGR
jgi:glycosyltransferase involved in cell wall biosynthesis